MDVYASRVTLWGEYLTLFFFFFVFYSLAVSLFSPFRDMEPGAWRSCRFFVDPGFELCFCAFAVCKEGRGIEGLLGFT